VTSIRAHLGRVTCLGDLNGAINPLHLSANVKAVSAETAHFGCSPQCRLTLVLRCGYNFKPSALELQDSLLQHPVRVDHPTITGAAP